MSGSCYVCLPVLEDDEEFRSDIESVFQEVAFADERPGRERLEDVANRFDILVVGTAENLDEEILRDSGLDIVASVSSGLDHIDLDFCREEDIEVVNSGKQNSLAVAEHTWMLILSLQKRLIESNSSVIEGEMREDITERPKEVYGKTLGIIGAGAITEEVIKRAEGFGCDILVWTFNPENHSELEDHGVEFEPSIEGLFEKSDIISVHIPLSKKTEGLISRKLIQNISIEDKKLLINTSRAEIIEEGLLQNNLVNDFSGLGLDVFREKEVLENGRIYYTPHIAGLTQEASRRMRDKVIEEIQEVSEEV